MVALRGRHPRGYVKAGLTATDLVLSMMQAGGRRACLLCSPAVGIDPLVEPEETGFIATESTVSLMQIGGWRARLSIPSTAASKLYYM